jgi:hypothetical protein
MSKTYNLPDGSEADVEITSRFLSTFGGANLADPDDVDEGRLLSFPGRIDPTTLPVTVKAEVAITTKRDGQYSVGFKQLGKIRQVYSQFWGTSTEFGSSVEQFSAPLSGQWLLDCACDLIDGPPYVVAPQAPFYLPKVPISMLSVPLIGRVGKSTIQMADRPTGGKPLLRRQNTKQDARNYLRDFIVKCDFVTFVVVEQPDGIHTPVQGLTWSYERQIGVEWSRDLNPRISTDIGGAVQTDVPILTLGDLTPGFANLLKDRGLKGSDCIDRKVYDAMQGAKHITTPGYQILEY